MVGALAATRPVPVPTTSAATWTRMARSTSRIAPSWRSTLSSRAVSPAPL